MGCVGVMGLPPVGSRCDKGKAGIPGDSARAMVVGVRHASRSPGCDSSDAAFGATIVFRRTALIRARLRSAVLPTPGCRRRFPRPALARRGYAPSSRMQADTRNSAFCAYLRPLVFRHPFRSPGATISFPRRPPWRAGGVRGGVCRLTRAPAARCLCCPVGQGVPVMQGDVAARKTAGTVEPRARPMYNNIRDLHVKQDVMGGGAVKKAFWGLWIGAIAVFFLDWAFMGISLLNGDYEIRTAVYLAAACFVVILAGAVYRLWSSRCPHCGKALPLRGKYCPHCGKEVGA